MLMWAIAAGASVLLVAFVLFLVFGRTEGESGAASVQATGSAVSADHASPVGHDSPDAADASANVGEGEEGRRTGSRMASDPPPASGMISTEVDVSILTPEDDVQDNGEDSGPMPRILVTAVGSTDAGRRRKHNEDAFMVLPEHSLFAIADGMGGYAAGEVASQMAVDVVTAAFETGHFGGEPIPGLPPRADELARAIQSANAAILKQARANEAQAGMGTTIVAARFSPNRKRVYIAHVGDSRLYRVRDSEIKQLTVDHTLGAMGIQGPSANKLSRAVGVFDEVEVDVNIDEPHNNDFYLICSDGLSKMVPEPEIAQLVLSTTDLDDAVARLIAEANARGGKDNVSVILIRVDEP